MVRWWVEDELDIHNMQVTMCHVLSVIAVRCPMFIDWLFWVVWFETVISRGVENGWTWQPLHCFFFHDVPNSIFDAPWEWLNLSASVFKGIHFIKFIEEDPSSIGSTRCKNWHHFVELHHTYPLQYGISWEGVVGTHQVWDRRSWISHPWPHHLVPPWRKNEGIPRHLQCALPQTASATDWHACRGGGSFLGNF